uniref:Uncharacterized protein n=1 Tax=Panagrolaimus davidi TaxID=227884 RepID=A0A914P8A6_9BILA
MDLSKKVISLPIQTQYFPFLPNFMKYILQNSSPKLLLKLYQCCKYFYFKSKITIAENVWYTNNPEEKVIRCGFYGKDGKGFYYHDYPNVGKLWLCDELHIKLEILSKSPNLIKADLHTTVKNENDEPIPIEEIMVLFPNMKKFEICPPHFTMESFHKLSKFKFSNKINSLGFRMIETEFDPISMCKFLQFRFH